MDIKQSHSPQALGFTPYVKRKNIEGVEFDFLVGDAAAKSWYDVDCTDPDWPEMRFMRDHLVKEGDVVFECGGHHGCTAVVLSHWVGATGKVVTFEPHPRNAAILRRNLELNRVVNTTFHQCAVGRHSGRIGMTDASNSSVRANGTAAVDAEVVSLDSFIDLKPTVLKIDVEGFEVEVLKGAVEVLKARPKLAIEIHTPELLNYGTSVEELLSCLDASAYQFWIQWDDDSYPVIYEPGATIVSRVHLFAIPLSSKS